MAEAFQDDAFQTDAFQTSGSEPEPESSGPPRVTARVYLFNEVICEPVNHSRVL